MKLTDAIKAASAADEAFDAALRAAGYANRFAWDKAKDDRPMAAYQAKVEADKVMQRAFEVSREPPTDPYALPSFLIVSQEDRRRAWEGYVHPPGVAQPEVEQRSRWDAIDQMKREKKRGGVKTMLARINDRTAAKAGQVWDEEAGKWVDRS